MIEEYAGTVSFGGGGGEDGGFSASLLIDYDRRYATGTLELYDDDKLDRDKAAAFLCADCLNEILPQRVEQSLGVGVIDLATKEIRIFENQLSGFTMGDFYIDCNLIASTKTTKRMSTLLFYCPIQY